MQRLRSQCKAMPSTSAVRWVQSHSTTSVFALTSSMAPCRKHGSRSVQSKQLDSWLWRYPSSHHGLEQPGASSALQWWRRSHHCRWLRPTDFAHWFLDSPYPSLSLTLNNILYVPNLHKNLISVYRLCNSNKVSVEFFLSPFRWRISARGPGYSKAELKMSYTSGQWHHPSPSHSLLHPRLKPLSTLGICALDTQLYLL